jgi:hypothetical protein
VEKHLTGLKAYLWEYLENRRNYPGYHFTATPLACEALQEHIQRMLETKGDKLSLQLAKLDPDDERKITGGQAFRDFRKLQLLYQPHSPERMTLVVEPERVVVLTFNASGANDLLLILHEVRQGRGDTSIRVTNLNATMKRERETSLWYWPCFGHLGAT